MTKDMLERLKKVAREETRDDMVRSGEADYESFICGNEDDAYQDGLRDGEIDMAREVLTSLQEKWY